MTVYKNVADEAVVTLSLVQAMFAGEVDGTALIETFGVACAYDTESYEKTPGNKVESFLLVPTTVTKDNLQYLVDIGLYEMGADGYLVAK